MAPDWEKLSEEWAGHGIGFIAEVDCTTEGKPLCDANGVKGFPTLKYGDPTSLEDYKGARTLDALSKFAKENLMPICSVANIALCSDDKKKDIEKFLAMSTSDIDAMIETEETKLKEAETSFEEKVKGLQAQYEAFSKEKDAALEAVKSSGLGLLKSVKAHKAKSEKKDEL
jgi:hypothetical protein